MGTTALRALYVSKRYHVTLTRGQEMRGFCFAEM